MVVHTRQEWKRQEWKDKSGVRPAILAILNKKTRVGSQDKSGVRPAILAILKIRVLSTKDPRIARIAGLTPFS